MQRPNLFIFLASIVIGTLGLSACDSGGSNDPGPDPTPAFDRTEMLINIGHNIIIPAYQSFQVAVDALDDATKAFAADPAVATLASLRTALNASWLSWQDVAPFQFGPADGVALRGALNTYPTDTDQVEANIASGNYVLGTVANLSAGGFPAIDYLINGLSDTDEAIVAMYTSDANAAGRRKYLEDNVAFIKTNTDTVVNDWTSPGGNYIGTFLSAEKGGLDVGSSIGEMLNAIVLHYERFIRDGKIGIPAGVRSSGIPRPKTTEAYYAGHSLELAIASVKALDRVYQGTGPNDVDGIGLDEHLQFLEAADLSSDIKTAFTEVIASLEQLSDPLSAQIESDLDSVIAVFTEMQELVVLLKADMTSMLGITITYQDNDGD